MLEDQRYILNRILDLLDDERPDAVLIAGDVYDRANPTADAMELLDEFLSVLALRGVCTMIISGNHDSPERLAYASRFLENRNIHISPVYNGHIEPIALSDAYGEVCFWLMPYVHPDSVGGFFADQTIRNAQDAAQAVIGEMRVDPNKCNVILSHQFIIGGTTSDSERRNIGTLENVDAALYHEEMDRTAAGLGHDPCTAVDLLRRAHARITPPYPDVKGKGCKQPGFAALDIRFRRRYGREKAVSVRPLPPHTSFCCLHLRRTFTQNSG